jgi:hypothetical protein
MDNRELTPEFILGNLIHCALALDEVHAEMAPKMFKRRIREFVATVPPDPAYGAALEHPGVAELLENSTVLELCELAASVIRARVQTIEREWPREERPTRVLRRDMMLLSIHARRQGTGLRTVARRGPSRERRSQTRRVTRTVAASRDGPQKPGDNEPPLASSRCLGGAG